MTAGYRTVCVFAIFEFFLFSVSSLRKKIENCCCGVGGRIPGLLGCLVLSLIGSIGSIGSMGSMGSMGSIGKVQVRYLRQSASQGPPSWADTFMHDDAESFPKISLAIRLSTSLIHIESILCSRQLWTLTDSCPVADLHTTYYRRWQEPTGIRLHQNAKTSAVRLLDLQKHLVLYQVYRSRDMTIDDAVEISFIAFRLGICRCTSHLPYRVNDHNSHPSSSFHQNFHQVSNACLIPCCKSHAYCGLAAHSYRPSHLFIKCPTCLPI